jgi:hypothetical protein
MFGLGSMLNSADGLLKLAQDEDFKKFFSDPRVQELMKDEDFKKTIQEKNMFKLMSNQKFAVLLKDPEIRSALELMAKKYGQKK